MERRPGYAADARLLIINCDDLQAPSAVGRRCNSRSSGSGRPATRNRSRTRADRTHSYFIERLWRSMKTLSIQRTRPYMLIRMSASSSFSTAVNAKLLNWLP